MTQTIIQVNSISKRYRIGVRTNSPQTLRETVQAMAVAPFQYLRQMTRPPTEEETLWALRNVSFEVERGEVLGVVGHNGAGKSTLLKILSRITEPTEGQAIINGRIGSLLEVGTGFHPELTGRENVYLNGAILGMKRKEIDRKFEEIVAFSEIEKFIDTPAKRYSSGMYVRLAFSVAAHLDAEILLLDEVLSVGDAAFRKKCQNKMYEVAGQGRTVLVVSHNTMTIQGLCSRAIWIDHGIEVANGPVDEIVQLYLQHLSDSAASNSAGQPQIGSGAADSNKQVNSSPEFGLIIDGIALKNIDGASTNQFQPGDDVIVEVHYTATRPIDKPQVWIAVDGVNGPCFGANMLLDGRGPSEIAGPGVLSCKFKSVPLLPQTYSVRLAIRASDGIAGIVEPQEVAFFRIVADLKRDYGFHGDFIESLASRSVPVIIPYEWTLPDGSVRPNQLGKVK